MKFLKNMVKPDISYNFVRVVAAIILRGSNILIAKRRNTDPLGGKWEFPGGKIEEGETPEDCLVREVKEELGIDVIPGDFFLTNRHIYNHMSVEISAYLSKYTGGDISLKDHSEAKWVAISDLIEYDFLIADKPIIDRLIESADDLPD